MASSLHASWNNSVNPQYKNPYNIYLLEAF